MSSRSARSLTSKDLGRSGPPPSRTGNSFPCVACRFGAWPVFLGTLCFQSLVPLAAFIFIFTNTSGPLLLGGHRELDSGPALTRGSHLEILYLFGSAEIHFQMSGHTQLPIVKTSIYLSGVHSSAYYSLFYKTAKRVSKLQS